MDAYETPIPEHVWGGKPWLTACCGGSCLGFIVFILIFIFIIRWLIGTEYLPRAEDIQSFLRL